MPANEGPVGPFPDGADPVEYDKLRRRVFWRVPSGLYAVGSRSADGARRNLMTLNWATQVGSEPKLLGIAVEKDAITHELIAESRVFTLNLVDREDRAIVRKFTKPVEVDTGSTGRTGPSSGSSRSRSRSTPAPGRSTGSRTTTATRAPRCSIRRSRSWSVRCATTSTRAAIRSSSARWSHRGSRRTRTLPCSEWKTPG